LHIEFRCAVNHVSAGSDRCEHIFVYDGDQRALPKVIAQVLSRFDADALACCLMGDLYHLVLHTRQASLSLPMRQTNTQLQARP